MKPQSLSMTEPVRELDFSGLRQLDCLTAKELPSLIDLMANQEVKLSDPNECICIILTHSCAVINCDLNKEPNVELLLAEVCENPDNGLMGRKNPRKLHLPILVDGTEKFFELNITNRAFLSKAYLSNVPAANNIKLNEKSKGTLIKWVADRYLAPAFPDNFNNRIKKASNKIAKKLSSQASGPIAGIYAEIEPLNEELSAEYPYELNIVIIHDEEITEVQKKGLLELASEIEEILRGAKSDGIDLNGTVLCKSENEIHLSDYRQLSLMQFDYLSERDIPGGIQPIKT